MDNKLEILSKLDFFSKLTESQKNNILTNCKMVTYTKGQNIYCASNECLGVIIVLRGELRAYMISDEGREVTLYRLCENDVCILSASCLLKKITFDVLIDAEKQTDALLINSSTFEHIQKNNVHAENFALTVATQRFSDVMWSMEQLLFYPLQKRISAFLFDEHNKISKQSINLTHEQIAKYIGSSREVVSKALKKLEKDGVLRLSNGLVEIIDVEALRLI